MQLLHLPLRAAAGGCIAFFLDLLNILTLPYDNASIVSYLLSAHFLCSSASVSFSFLNTFIAFHVYAVFKVRPSCTYSCHAFAFHSRALSRFILLMGKVFKWTGGHLLSRTVSSAVPSADRVLTVVFGMGTGVSPGRIAARSFCYLRASSRH